MPNDERADLSAPVLPPPGSEAEAEMVRLMGDAYETAYANRYGFSRDFTMRAILAAIRATAQPKEGE